MAKQTRCRTNDFIPQIKLRHCPRDVLFDAGLRLCYSLANAQHSCDFDYGRSGDVCHAATASGGIVHPFERAESGGLQGQLLRKHDLLCGLAEKQRTCIPATRTARCGQTSGHWTPRNCAHRPSRSVFSTGASCLRRRYSPRAFAASSRGDLHSSHLIQRR